MRSLWPQLAAWLDESAAPFALATVTAVSGSAPRAPGACMAIMPATLRFMGSVSSGCLDSEIVEAAETALRTSAPQTLRFGPDGKPPWSDGLSCGGWISVRVEPWWGYHPRAEVRAIAPLVRRWLADDETGAVLTRGDAHVGLDLAGTMAGDRASFSEAVLEQARARLLREQPSGTLSLPAENPDSVFFRAIRRRPRLLVVGGADVSVHLVRFAEEIGFATIIVDPRAAFVAADRFVTAPTRVLRAWPQEVVSELKLGWRDAALTLTHDPKIDDPALRALMQSGVGYIGALGSSRSHAARLERLRAEGVDEIQLQRIQGPAGIHLGTPDAPGIALGIAAGLAAWRAKRDVAHAAADVDLAGGAREATFARR